MTSRAFELAQTMDEDGDLTLTGDMSVTGDLTFDGTGFLKIPNGTTAQRPSSSLSGGMIRYNNTLGKYEGYHTAEWLNLTDITDKDSDTKITVHEAWGNDEDELKFYVGDSGAGNEKMLINTSSITSSTTLHTLGASHLALNAEHVVISGNLTVQGTQTTISSTILETADKTIEVSKNATPTNATATGAGIFVNDGVANNIMAYDSTVGGFLFQRQGSADPAVPATDNIANLKLTGALSFINDEKISNPTDGSLKLEAKVILGSNIIQNSSEEDTITLTAGQDVQVANKITVGGDQILRGHSDGTVITFGTGKSTTFANNAIVTGALTIGGGSPVAPSTTVGKILKCSDANGLSEWASFGVFNAAGVRQGP
jgi:hypothetical protein